VSNSITFSGLKSVWMICSSLQEQTDDQVSTQQLLQLQQPCKCRQSRSTNSAKPANPNRCTRIRLLAAVHTPTSMH
jgi:hypothetical protein